MASPLGDRRRYLRLEVMGALWGTLDGDRFVRVVNLSSHGTLVSSPGSAEVGAGATMQLMLQGRDIRLRCRVRHAAPPRAAREVRPPAEFLIGLEFLDPPEALLAALAEREHHIRTRFVR